MKLNSTLLLAVATATLALTSCSSEPSDWRPEEKVSLDRVAPGTRNSENFSGTVPNRSIENANSPLIEAAANENRSPASDTHRVSAEEAMSANAEQGMRKRGLLNDAGKSGQGADSAANGHQVRH